MTTTPFPALAPIYNKAPLTFVRGEGAWLTSDTGARYLDFVGGMAVVALGHANPILRQVLQDQAEKIWTISNLFYNEPIQKLAQRLVDVSFADTVIFQNSGAEAWECGAKLVRKHFTSVGKPKQWRIITFQGCFHGRTFAAIAAANRGKLIEGFGPVMDGFDVVPWDDLDAVKAAITPETAAIHIEPVQGEGGMRAASIPFLQGLRKLCDDHGLLLYFDEIQCGMGRTGTFFAYEQLDVTPDVLCIAKALGNGYPIGACLATAHAAQGMTGGSHGSTFGGNPIAGALGNAVLDIMFADGFFAGVRQRSAYLWQRIDDLIVCYPNVFVEHRGRGFMQGIKCVPPNSEVVKKLYAENVLMVEAGDNVLRMLPPLIVSEAEIDTAVAALERVAKGY